MAENMKCDYAEVEARLPGQFAAFECKNCKKKITIPVALKDKFSDIVSRMPPCEKLAQKIPREPGVTAVQSRGVPQPPPISSLNLAGAGTQLKRLLSKVGIKSTANCSCNARARKMDEMGIEWCEENINEIVGWLKEEAQKRNLPFLAFPTKILVQRAISMAKRVRDSQPTTTAASAETETNEQLQQNN